MENVSKQNVFSFCMSFLLSAFGYEFIFFIMTLHIFDLTKNALNVSLFAIITFIPKLLSPFYGTLADKFARQWVLGIVALLTAGLMFCLSLTNEIIGVYILWFFISVALNLISNVRGSLFAEVLPMQNYQAGNSIMLIISNSARVAAPLIGGVAAFAFSINYLFYTVSLIYIAAAIFCIFIKPVLQPRLPLKNEIKGSWQAGFQFIKNSSCLTYLVKIGFLWRLFLGLQTSLLVVFIKTYLDGNDIQYGYFMTLLSLGSILGSFIGPWLGKRFSEKKIILYGLCLHYGTFAALGVINQLAEAYLMIFVSFLIFYATLVSMHTIRDLSTRSSIRGRVYGSVTALITPPAVISMLVGGYLAEFVGVQWILLGAGILAVLSLVGISLRNPFWVEEIQPENTPTAYMD